MKLEQALNDVQGMIRCIKIGESKPKQRELMHLGGFQWILDEKSGVGVTSDSHPPDWCVDADKLPALLSLARVNPYALEAARKIIDMHLADCRPLPKPLADFVMEWLDKPPKRKKTESPTIRARDEFLAVLVAYLKVKTGSHIGHKTEREREDTASELVVKVFGEETGEWVGLATVKKAHTKHRPSWDR